MSDIYDEILLAKHYNMHPSMVECIDLIRDMPYSLGAAIKYIWRLGKKDDEAKEWGKAEYYFKDYYPFSTELTCRQKTLLERVMTSETVPGSTYSIYNSLYRGDFYYPIIVCQKQRRRIDGSL